MVKSGGLFAVSLLPVPTSYIIIYRYVAAASLVGLSDRVPTLLCHQRHLGSQFHFQFANRPLPWHPDRTHT